MMETDALWRHVVHLIRRLEGRDYGPPLRGRLTVADAKDRDALDACLENSSDTNVEIDGIKATDEISVGATVTVSIDPRFGFGLIAQDLDGVLTAQGFRVAGGRRYFLLDGLVDSTDRSDKRSQAGRHGLVIAMVQQLRAAALYLDAD